MVNLATTLEILSHNIIELEENWEKIMDVILNSHRSFLKKCGVIYGSHLYFRTSIKQSEGISVIHDQWYVHINYLIFLDYIPMGCTLCIDM